jgi:protein CpxP
MRTHRALAAAGVLAAGLILTATSFAAPPGGPPDGERDRACGRMGPHDFHLMPPPGVGGPGHFFGMGMGMGMGPEWGGPPPFLAGLDLTDDQQDKVFSIVHAAAPAIREQAKALRKAHEALRELDTSAQYDESRAKSLADTAAKADSQLMLLRVHAEHEIYALLTPEQRKDLEERRQEHRHGPPKP